MARAEPLRVCTASFQSPAAEPSLICSKGPESWSLNNLGPRMIDRNFEPGFFVEHFLKDMGIALEESKRMGLAMPGLALANQLYLAVQAQGYGRKGTHALMLALESLANVKR